MSNRTGGYPRPTPSTSGEGEVTEEEVEAALASFKKAISEHLFPNDCMRSALLAARKVKAEGVLKRSLSTPSVQEAEVAGGMPVPNNPETLAQFRAIKLQDVARQTEVNAKLLAAAKRLAVAEVHRLAYGGGTVIWGYRCNLCSAEREGNDPAIKDAPGFHNPDCPIAAADTPSVQVNAGLEHDGLRWRALLNSPRLRMQGWSGFDERGRFKPSMDPRGYMHFGMEVWSHFADAGAGNDLARTILTEYVDKRIQQSASRSVQTNRQ